MTDLNHLSLEDLVNFASGGDLPEEQGEENKRVAAPKEEESGGDFNDLSPEELLAMAEGRDLPEKEKEEKKEEEDIEAKDESELLAMLEDTIGEHELSSNPKQEAKEAAQGIDRIKIRQIANTIEKMAPSNFFKQHKDEVFYFISALAGQSDSRVMDNAEEKCAFIGEALNSLEEYCLSEAGITIDEYEALKLLFKDFSAKTVKDTSGRDRVKQNFRAGWRQTLSVTRRDTDNLSRFARERYKPIWIIQKYYESLTRAYALCRSEADLKQFGDEVNVKMSDEERKQIIEVFEDLVEMGPFFGLKKIRSVTRKGIFEEIEAMNLGELLKKIKLAAQKR